MRTRASVARIDWLEFNGTFTIYRAFDKYVTFKKEKLMRKLTVLRVGKTHNKPLQ